MPSTAKGSANGGNVKGGMSATAKLSGLLGFNVGGAGTAVRLAIELHAIVSKRTISPETKSAQQVHGDDIPETDVCMSSLCGTRDVARNSDGKVDNFKDGSADPMTSSNRVTEQQMPLSRNAFQIDTSNMSLLCNYLIIMRYHLM